LDEKTDLEHRLQNMDSAITQANDTGKPDLVMRAELDHIKQDLAKSEDKRHEMEQSLYEHVQSIHELKRKIDDLTHQSDETDSLRGQLDRYQPTIERLRTTEEAVDNYKRKAEETADLRRHIKALEEQNTSLLERSHQVEDEYRKVLAFKTLMDSYKQQVQQLESSHLEIVKVKDQLDAQMASLVGRSACLEGERDRGAERMQILEDHIKELELVGAGMTLDKVVSETSGEQHGEPVDLDCQNDIEENLKETNETEL
jgi:protein HOOK3